jgi:hypothetical protein
LWVPPRQRAGHNALSGYVIQLEIELVGLAAEFNAKHVVRKIKEVFYSGHR